MNRNVEDKRDLTKQKILACATRLFAERGYDGVSVRAICTEAQISLPMISYYFRNKAGLYKAVLEDLTDNFNKEFKSICWDEIPSKLRLRKYLEAAVKAHLKNPFFSGVFNHEAYPSPMLLEVMKSKENYYFGDYIARLIEDSQKAGALRADIAPLYAARIIASLFNSHPTISNLYHAFYNNTPPVEEILESVVKFCLRALEQEES